MHPRKMVSRRRPQGDGAQTARENPQAGGVPSGKRHGEAGGGDMEMGGGMEKGESYACWPCGHGNAWVVRVSGW